MNDEARGTGGLDPARKIGRGSERRGPDGVGGRHMVSARPATAGQAGLRHGEPTYAALDLGTNNCRLLVARPTGDSFRVIDAFSRIIRLGEGVSASRPHLRRRRSTARSRRSRICRDKMRNRGVTRARLIATEACRAAENGAEFRARIAEEVGLELEIVDRETEATLAATGCTPLIDPQAEGVILFDIGGGSSELVRLGRCAPTPARPAAAADQGLGLAAGRRGHARRAPRRSRGDAGDLRAMIDEVAGVRRPLRGRARQRSRSIAFTCSAPPAR